MRMDVKIAEIKIDHFSDNLDEFIKAAADMMIDPVNTAALFVFALNVYAEEKEKGLPLIAFLLEENRKAANLNILEKKKQIARSYLKGAGPDNGYTPSLPHTVIVRSDGEKGIKRNLKTVYTGCGGTDSYRPLTLIKIKRRKVKIKSSIDLWFIYEYSSLLLDVKEPIIK